MDWRGGPGLSGGSLNGRVAPSTTSPIDGTPSPDPSAASLAALLKMRAQAQSAGLPDLEQQLRERIRSALPIRRIEPDSGEPVPEISENPPRTGSAVPDEAAPQESTPDEAIPNEEFPIELSFPPGQPVRTKIALLATLPALEGRRSERRVLNLAADLREEGASIAEVEVANISQHGFLIQGDSGLELEIGSFAWLKLPGFEPFKSQVMRVAGGRLGGRFLTPLYPAVLELILKEEPKAKQRRLFHPPRPSAAA